MIDNTIRQKQYNICIKICFLIFILLIIGGCRSSSTTVFNSNRTTVDKNRDEILTDVIDSSLIYKDIAVKSSIELLSLESNKSIKTNCYVRIIHNKGIQLSIRMPLINSEIFRINLTPDSLFIIDRMAKKYATESFKSLTEEKGISFNFYNVQALLTNSLFLPGNLKVEKKDFKNFYVTKESNVYNILIKDKNATLSKFVVNNSDRIQETTIQNPTYKFTTTWQYLDFVKNEGGNVYPTNIQTKIFIENKALGLNISYNELDLDRNLMIDYQIPKKYQQIRISDLLNAYLK